MDKTALITGITGQDGSYLAELLLDGGYAVHGIIRRASNFNTQRIDHLYGNENLTLHYGDLLDSAALAATINTVEPDEVYNLGCQSHVKTSFDQPVYTAETVAIGSLALLEAVRAFRDRTGRDVRYYQASSSEMFGNAPAPQTETTPFRPCSPYACAKVQAYWQTVNYREAYGLHATNGILFNHESPRRGETFVTRKITRAATRIKLGLQDEIRLGNLDAARDWGYAPDYVQAMWLMVQADEPDDFLIATGCTITVEEWLAYVFKRLDLDPEHYMVVDERYFRPVEVDHLCGDPTKAKELLGWEPTIFAGGLADLMVDADMRLAKMEKAQQLAADAA